MEKFNLTKKVKKYYITLILLLPFSILFFGIGMIGTLFLMLSNHFEKIELWYKSIIKKIIREKHKSEEINFILKLIDEHEEMNYWLEKFNIRVK